jgi:hypothetical protein
MRAYGRRQWNARNRRELPFALTPAHGLLAGGASIVRETQNDSTTYGLLMDPPANPAWRWAWPAGEAARSILAEMSRTPPILKASAPRRAQSPPWLRPASAASPKSASSAMAKTSAPCGGCRQRIREFADAETVVHVAGREGVRARFTLCRNPLAPAIFGPREGRRAPARIGV